MTLSHQRTKIGVRTWSLGSSAFCTSIFCREAAHNGNRNKAFRWAYVLSHPSISHTPPCCLEDWLPRARKKAPYLFRRNEKNPSLIAVILSPHPPPPPPLCHFSLCVWVDWDHGWEELENAAQEGWRMPRVKGGIFQVCPLWFLLWCCWRRVFQGLWLWGHIHGRCAASRCRASVLYNIHPVSFLEAVGPGKSQRAKVKPLLHRVGRGPVPLPSLLVLSVKCTLPGWVGTSLEARPWRCFTCLKMIIIFTVTKGQESHFYEWWKDPELKRFSKEPIKDWIFVFFLFSVHMALWRYWGLMVRLQSTVSDRIIWERITPRRQFALVPAFYYFLI